MVISNNKSTKKRFKNTGNTKTSTQKPPARQGNAKSQDGQSTHQTSDARDIIERLTVGEKCYQRGTSMENRLAAQYYTTYCRVNEVTTWSTNLEMLNLSRLFKDVQTN